MTIDYYEALGVDRNAGGDDIKKAYRKLALKFHPDRNPGDNHAEEQFKAINEAYGCLSDPEKKANYDRFGSAEGPAGFGGGGFGGAGFGDVFEDIFEGFFGGGFAGRGASRAARGTDLRYDMEITLEEAAFGAEKEIAVPRWQRCESCEGSGARPGTSPVTCPTCQGHGQVRMQQGFFSIARTCTRCGGAGRTIEDPCPGCSGHGRTRRERTVSVKVPPGVDSGTRLKMTAEGELGSQGGPPGDLYIVIDVADHELFAREGDHLICDQRISFAQAAMGTELRIPTLEGKTAHLKIPGGTESHQLFRLRGKGVPNLRGQGRGDLLVRTIIQVPRKLSEEQKHLLQEFAAISGETTAPPSKGFVDRLEDRVRDFFTGE